MRKVIKCVVIGYMVAAYCYQFDPYLGDFILYSVIPFGVSLDKVYIILQELKNFLVVTPTLTLPPIEAQMLYAELLLSLGYDFLSQFDELELLTLYLHWVYNNIMVSL